MKKIYGWIAVLMMACTCLSSCDNGDTPGDDPNEEKSDSLWYDITHVKTFTMTEFVDSLCSVEEAAREHMGLLTAIVPKDIQITVYDYLYESNNGHGQTARLSAQLLVPTRGGVVTKEMLIIDNHATQVSDADVPTNKLNIGAVLALTGSPVVTADLLGYGSTVNLPISYNCHHTAAVNTVDAALVAQQMLQSKWMRLNLTTNPLPVYNEGYSQGGYDALAVHRYLETEASSQVRKQLPLMKTKCGAGAYDQRAFLEAVLKWDNYSYSPYIATSILSFLNYHGDLFPEGFSINDVLSEKIRSSELVQRIQSKKYSDREIKDYVRQVLDDDISISNLFVEDFINPDGKLHGICLKVAEHESLLTGWKPQGYIDFFHATNDDCVPVECMYAAREAFKDCPHVTFEESPAPAVNGLHSLSYVKFITGIIFSGWE